MEATKSSDSDRTPAVTDRPESISLTWNNEPIAWEPIEDDLWIPYRIRGSFRGEALG